jgi:hypothetical protein
MKKLKIITFGFASILLVIFIHVNFGLFTRFNAITAYYDQFNGIERIVFYGEPYKTDSIKSALARTYGFRYEREANCEVTVPFLNGVKIYNEIMGHYIHKRLGKSWEETLESDIGNMKH